MTTVRTDRLYQIYAGRPPRKQSAFWCLVKCQALSIHTYLHTAWSRVLLEKLTGFSASQEIPRILWNTKVYYRIYKSPPPVRIWSQLGQVHTPHPTSRRSILILSSHLRLFLPIGVFPPDFPTKTLYTPLPSPIRATFPAHLILLHFIKRTILGEQYRSLSSSSLCSFLNSPVTSSLLHPKGGVQQGAKLPELLCENP